MAADYAFRARLDVPYEEALEKVRIALKTEGFGILTLVDMKATLEAKLGAEFRKYSILGACNPSLAQRALAQDLDAGLVLPCKVVVCEDEGGSSVLIANPLSVVNLLGNPLLEPVAKEAAEKLSRALAVLTDQLQK